MKNSIKLKYGDELEAIMDKPILLSIIVRIAFTMDEETGEAVIEFPKEWEEKIAFLVLSGYVKHKDYKIFSLTNKKIVDITIKRKPTKASIDNQPLFNPAVIPEELLEYHKMALAFRDLFYKNLKSIGGRVYNLERAKFGKWVTPIRLMIESDEITADQLREVFKFLNKSDFWRDKVQSTEKLRVKFNTLYNQSKSDERRVNTKSAKVGGNPVNTEYIKRVFDELHN